MFDSVFDKGSIIHWLIVVVIRLNGRLDKPLFSKQYGYSGRFIGYEASEDESKTILT